MATNRIDQQPASVDLYWLPLGSGTACVRWNGRVFEAIAARHAHRAMCDLYHSALVIHVDGARFVIEMTPAWGGTVPDRGVVCEGPVGLRWLGRSQFFRYEVRRWRDGVIADLSEAVASPVRVSADTALAERLLELVPSFPAVTWGRDDFHTGEMWNSNSLTSWLLARSGHDVRGVDLRGVDLPKGGRAPGWSAGLIVAARPTEGDRTGGPITRPALR